MRDRREWCSCKARAKPRSGNVLPVRWSDERARNAADAPLSPVAHALRKFCNLPQPLVRVHAGGVAVGPQEADRVAADAFVARGPRVIGVDAARVARVALAG